MKYLYLILAVCFAHTALAADTMSDDRVFVLKHPDPAKGAAFVRVTDREQMADLVDHQGYELVVKRQDDGTVIPVTGEIVPQATAAEQMGQVQATADYELRDSTEVKRDPIDIGLGLAIGLTTGPKVRILGTLPSGITVGVDLDAGTVIFISEATISGMLGYSFQAGRHVLRPYLTVGGGSSVIFAILALAKGTTFHAGAGFEWKPAKWFGLGLEGGIAYWFQTPDGSSNPTNLRYPYGRLTLMFYFL